MSDFGDKPRPGGISGGYGALDRIPLAHFATWLPFNTFEKISNKGSNPVHVDMTRCGVNNEFRLLLPPQDRGLGMQLRAFGFREPLNCKCYVDFIEADDTLLDIGSNIGFFAVLGGKAKRIICVEPLDEAIGMLKENIKLNNLAAKCEIIHAAVGPRGKLQLEVSNHLNLSKIVSEKSGRTIEVDSIPLESLVEEHQANAVRMDVEGFEYDILYRHIPSLVDKISMEFHTGLLGNEKSLDLIRYFDEEGFEVRYFVEDVPLRLYPFVRVFGNTRAAGFVSFVEEHLDVKDLPNRVFRGRSLKYLYLQRK